MTGVRTRPFAWLALTVLCALVGPAAAGAATNNIFTVAGTGVDGFSGNGGTATAAQLSGPSDVAVTADGGYLIADSGNDRVRRVSPAGTITTAAGNGLAGFTGDGGAATAAQLNVPIGVAVTADGGFLIADSGNERVRRVSPAGTITTVAGTGTTGFAGDGAAATAAELDSPESVAVTADGGFLIADMNNRRIRRVSPAGTIATVAGNGTFGFTGDGGPATAAQLSFPRGVEVTADGGFLIADRSQRVRRVSSAGTITTAAGGGSCGSPGCGDGGPATAAQLHEPNDVMVTADGGFLVSDGGSFSVRRVSPDGRITTVAGNGNPTHAGDGGPATAAQLNPGGMAATADGGFLVSATSHRIRFVDADLRGPSSGPPGPQGPAGTQGPAGLQGATGPVRLAAALADSRYRARRGRSLRLRYVVTRSARVTLDVRKGRKRVARKVANAAAGRNQIRLRAPKKTGRYTLRFSVRSSDGQATSDRARLVVSR